MTKRYRVELTGAQLAVLFVIADEGMNSPDGPCADGRISKREARAVRAKLVALLDKRDEYERAQLPPPDPIPASFLDGSHDPERADCACDWCEAGRCDCDHSSTAGAPVGGSWLVTCTRCGFVLRRDPLRDRLARVIAGTGDSGEQRELRALVRGLRA